MAEKQLPLSKDIDPVPMPQYRYTMNVDISTVVRVPILINAATQDEAEKLIEERFGGIIDRNPVSLRFGGGDFVIQRDDGDIFDTKDDDLLDEINSWVDISLDDIEDVTFYEYGRTTQ